ncbi:0eb373c0-6ff0-40bc-9845-ebef9188b53b [Sclerotinia trifoliorum]|uniref:0eb373c0-6ff0-40bc-9845-ebef9188b53b n=1 Tax=Sclerotinia trifoliorum TaxID=28548 RepID=A0A8H2VZG9_9HELO|nr:0eb373c0-6ff0-40bc-9845-ebef9188b53b [Sclerotinia trifoliorum]
MHPKSLLIFFFLAVCHSAVSKFQGGNFDTKNNDAAHAIVATFKTILTTRNTKTADHGLEMTLSLEEAAATTTTTNFRTSSNLVQSKKRRNTLYSGPLVGITSSAVSTEFANLVIPNFTTFSLPVSTISANLYGCYGRYASIHRCFFWDMSATASISTPTLIPYEQLLIWFLVRGCIAECGLSV